MSKVHGYSTEDVHRWQHLQFWAPDLGNCEPDVYCLGHAFATAAIRNKYSWQCIPLATWSVSVPKQGVGGTGHAVQQGCGWQM